MVVENENSSNMNDEISTNISSHTLEDLNLENSNVKKFMYEVEDQLSQYPFWSLDNILQVGSYVIFEMNGGRIRIKVKEIENSALNSHIIYLLHEAVTQYVKKRRSVRMSTKLDLLAKRNTLVIEIKAGKK